MVFIEIPLLCDGYYCACFFLCVGTSNEIMKKAKKNKKLSGSRLHDNILLYQEYCSQSTFSFVKKEVFSIVRFQFQQIVVHVGLPLKSWPKEKGKT